MDAIVNDSAVTGAAGRPTPRMAHGALVAKLLALKVPVRYEDKGLALIEHDDADLPYLALEVLGANGQFETVFEMLLIHEQTSRRFQLPCVVKLSKKGHPVVLPMAVEAGKPTGNMPQAGQPEQRS